MKRPGRKACSGVGSQKTSLNRVRVELSAQIGYEYTYDQIKNKWSHLKSKHGAFLQLAQSTGVIPNWETGQLWAEDHHWDRLEKLHRQGKALRQKWFPHYLRISALVAGSRATGKNAHPSTKSPSITDSSDDPEPVTIKKEKSNDGTHVLSDDDEEGFMIYRAKGKGKGNGKVVEEIRKSFSVEKSSGSSRSSSGRKGDSYSANLCNSISELAASAKKKAEYIDTKLDIMRAKSVSSPLKNLQLQKKEENNYSKKKLMSILNQLESDGSINYDTYQRGVMVLKDPNNRELLVEVPPLK